MDTFLSKFDSSPGNPAPNALDSCRISEARQVHAGIRHDDIQRTLVKELVDCRNKAEAMLAIAGESHGNVKELYTQLAVSFEYSARLIEEIKRASPEQK